MRTAHIGPLTLDGTPRIAAIIDRIMPIPDVHAIVSRGADLLEMRLDLMGEDDGMVRAYLAAVRAVVRVPLLGTLRETKANRGRRAAIFEKIVPLVDAIDIEVDTPIRDEVIAMAAGRTIVVSEHDYHRMPSVNRLAEIADQAHMAGAHIVKVAGTARSGDDVARLLTFCRECPYPMVAIAMGEHGTVSRVLAPLFGSLFSYAFVNESVAPGQLSLEDLKREFARYYPPRAG